MYLIIEGLLYIVGGTILLFTGYYIASREQVAQVGPALGTFKFIKRMFK